MRKLAMLMVNILECKHKVIRSVYHECDHIYSESECAEVEDFETALLYYMDKAEIRAHSKELAHEYYTAYPNAKFNYTLLKEHIEKNYKPTEKVYNTLRYLELMRNPLKFQSANQDIMDYIKNRIFTIGHRISQRQLQIAFRSYLSYIAYFVKLFNEHNV